MDEKIEMVMISGEIPAKDRERLKHWAVVNKRSLSFGLREAISEFLEKNNA